MPPAIRSPFGSVAKAWTTTLRLPSPAPTGVHALPFQRATPSPPRPTTLGNVPPAITSPFASGATAVTLSLEVLPRPGPNENHADPLRRAILFAATDRKSVV